MIAYLWKHRERPTPLGKRWLVVWAKRLLNAYGLLRIVLYRMPHSLRGTRIGELSIVYGLEVDGPDANLSIGDQTFIGPGVHVATHAKVSIGSFVCINNNVRLLSGSHDLSDPLWRMYSEPIRIEDFAWIATGATILPGVRIGRGACVAAGALVAKDVPDYAVAFGNPAQVRLDRRSRDLRYSPVISSAPYEAWIGRNVDLKKSTRSAPV